MALHEDLIITTTLLRRFGYEASADDGDGRYYALIRRDSGELLAHHPIGKPADPMQLVWADRLLTMLNRELHHDGAWVIVFTHPKMPTLDNVLLDPSHWMYGRYALIWLDKDGDPQFTSDWMEGTGEMRTFAEVFMAGLPAIGELCEQSWKLWQHSQRVLDIKADQTYRRARGERAPSARALN